MIIGILIQAKMSDPDLDTQTGYRLLCSGLVVGLGCLSSGFGISRFLEMYMLQYSQGTVLESSNQTVGDGGYKEASSLMGTHGTSVIARNVNNLPVTWGVVYTMLLLEAIGLYSLIVALFLSS
jgi:F0F1-type ATP synthase membrane subunit c/vacuolar-type H+-ATPase subunit K